MVLEPLARRGLQPLPKRGGVHVQHGGGRGGLSQRFAQVGSAGAQPDPIKAVLFATERFAQLALQVQVLLAVGIDPVDARGAGHATADTLAAPWLES